MCRGCVRTVKTVKIAVGREQNAWPLQHLAQSSIGPVQVAIVNHTCEDDMKWCDEETMKASIIDDDLAPNVSILA